MLTVIAMTGVPIGVDPGTWGRANGPLFMAGVLTQTIGSQTQTLNFSHC